jgi:hypothetical protein
MRRRIGWAFALAGLTALGHSGCALPPAATRSAPASPLWSPLAGPSPAKTADPFRPETSKPPAGATASASNTGTHWWQNYRPGSLLFRRNKPAPSATAAKASPPAPAVASSERFSDESLAQFFPKLYGRGNGEPERLARAGRPPRDDSASKEATGTRLASSRRPTAGPDEPAPVLPVGLSVEAYPGRKPAARPEVELTGREEAVDERVANGRKPLSVPKPVGATSSSDPAPRKPDLMDALSTELQLDSGSDRTPAPTMRDGSRSRDDAPVRPASPPTSETVEKTSFARRSQGEIDRRDEPELAVGPLASPSTPAEGHMATHSRPAARVQAPPAREAGDPSLAGRPRYRKAEAIDLPPPEFPATYHTESVRQVIREAASARRLPTPEPSPHKPLLPRLSRLLWGPDSDTSAKPNEARNAN